MPISLIPFILSEAGVLPKYSTLLLLVPMALIIISKIHTIKIDKYAYLMILILMLQLSLKGIESVREVNFGSIAGLVNYIIILLVYLSILSIGNITKTVRLFIFFVMLISFFATLSFFVAALGYVILPKINTQ
jgi:hypothetical protein